MLTFNMTKMSPLSLIVIVLPYLLYGFGCVDSLIVDSPHPPMVCAPDACMIGTTMSGWDLNNTFEAFMGIPYAEAPVGPLRFSNPKALPKSKEILNATAPKPDCIQKNYLMTPPEISGSEDCLYLNVYRPMNRTKALLPVMVYIHGGGWFSGSASPVITGPEYFMDTNSVILVTIAYRLGPFGFLSTHDKIMPGNFGLKDQNVALRWVQKNIQAFGGNPRWVTLFGQSAGAVSVHLHMMSKLSAGLFGRAIMLSGTANVPFAITDNPLNQTRQLATFCKIEKAEELSTLKLTEALRELNATEILNGADKFKYWHIDTLVNFRAVVEKPILTTSFLPYTPVSIQKAYTYRAMPMMFGMVPNEGAVRVVSIYENPKLRSEFNSRFDELLEKILEFPANFNATKRKEKTEKVIDEYFQGFHELNNYTIRGLIDTITDRGFRNPLYNTIRDHIKKVDTFKYPLRLYMFDYLGSRSFVNMYTNNPKPRQYGVVHSDDLLYLFRSPLLFQDLVRGSPEELVMKTMVGHLIDFAKSSKPLPIVKACNSKTFYKPECGNEICDYVLFSRGENGTLISKAATDFKVNRMHFWNHLLR